MLEILKHSLGLCGEHHPNIFTLLIGGLGSLPILSYIKYKIKSYDKNQPRSSFMSIRKK